MADEYNKIFEDFLKRKERPIPGLTREQQNELEHLVGSYEGPTGTSFAQTHSPSVIDTNRIVQASEAGLSLDSDELRNVIRSRSDVSDIEPVTVLDKEGKTVGVKLSDAGTQIETAAEEAARIAKESPPKPPAKPKNWAKFTPEENGVRSFERLTEFGDAPKRSSDLLGAFQRLGFSVEDVEQMAAGKIDANSAIEARYKQLLNAAPEARKAKAIAYYEEAINMIAGKKASLADAIQTISLPRLKQAVVQQHLADHIGSFGWKAETFGTGKKAVTLFSFPLEHLNKAEKYALRDALKKAGFDWGHDISVINPPSLGGAEIICIRGFKGKPVTLEKILEHVRPAFPGPEIKSAVADTIAKVADGAKPTPIHVPAMPGSPMIPDVSVLKTPVEPTVSSSGGGYYGGYGGGYGVEASETAAKNLARNESQFARRSEQALESAAHGNKVALALGATAIGGWALWEMMRRSGKKAAEKLAFKPAADVSLGNAERSSSLENQLPTSTSPSRS